MVNFWWVNQNQTWKQEIAGSYLWSPKKSRGGAFNHFYENMRATEPGDVVFSYYGQKIQQVGVVQSHAVSGNKPLNFGAAGQAWDNDGWFVPVAWSPVETPFRPRDHISNLRALLPDKYAPLDQNGNGRQNVYLAHVSEEMAHLILSLGKINLPEHGILIDAHSGDAAMERLNDEVERTIRNDTSIDETERRVIIAARRGQGRFRRNLGEIEKCCRVTGVSDDRLLIASHIKPWRSCANNHERLDGCNGLLLAPHIDHLFDKGYITFSDSGDMEVSLQIGDDQLARLGVKKSLNVGSFTPEQCCYLTYHRETVFRRKKALG